MLVRSLLSAGIDTTSTGIGNALWCFASHPEQYDLLKRNPTSARAAFDEVLRYCSPVHSFYRTANVDIAVSGVIIPESTKIMCCIGAGNLDDWQWDNAASFDIVRGARAHLGFGVGIHSCVGQNIARQEGTAILSAIARKVARIECAGDPEWKPTNAIHALEQLPIRFVSN